MKANCPNDLAWTAQRVRGIQKQDMVDGPQSVGGQKGGQPNQSKRLGRYSSLQMARFARAAPCQIGHPSPLRFGSFFTASRRFLPATSISTMDTNPQRPNRRENTLSLLNVAIEATNLTKEILSIMPAKAVCGSVSVQILITIRVSSSLICFG